MIRTEDELLEVLKRESGNGGRRVRLGYSYNAARIVVQRVLPHVASTGSTDYGPSNEELTSLCLDEYKQNQAVGFLGLGMISLWFAQAFISWAVQRLLRYQFEKNNA